MKRHTSRKNPRLIAAIAAVCFAAGVTAAPVVTIMATAPAAHASVVADSPDCSGNCPNG
jgi:hypothetical protein